MGGTSSQPEQKAATIRSHRSAQVPVAHQQCSPSRRSGQVPVLQQQRPTPELGNLPPGWESATSSSGKTYYFNRATGIRQWHYPLCNHPCDSPASVPRSGVMDRGPQQQKPATSIQQPAASNRSHQQQPPTNGNGRPKRRRNRRTNRGSQQNYPIHGGSASTHATYAAPAQRRGAASATYSAPVTRRSDDMDDLFLDEYHDLDWLRDDHPELDSDGLVDLYERMQMEDAEEFAGECYGSD